MVPDKVGHHLRSCLCARNFGIDPDDLGGRASRKQEFLFVVQLDDVVTTQW